MLKYQLSEDLAQVVRERITALEGRDGKKDVHGLSIDLINLVRSSAGPLIEPRPGSYSYIDLFEAINQKQIVYFLLDSMGDRESSIMIGKLILQDLISTVGLIYNKVAENQRVPCQVIVDEFASFATENFIDLINRARGANVGIMVAHQSRGDLRQVDDYFCDRLERNCATKLIFGTDNSEDAEYFASMLGTRTVVKETWQTKEESIFLGLGAKDQDTGTKSMREVEEFVIHPNVIKTLGQGHVLRISRLVDIVSQVVKIDRAPEYLELGALDERSMLLEAERPIVEIRKDMAVLDAVVKEMVTRDDEVFV